MERLDNQIIKNLGSEQMEPLKYEGRGVINCRSKLKRGMSVGDEIQKIIDARTSGSESIRK
ncbi:MAG: hypothetical protein ACLFNS_10790 [Desulfobacterales bacterium]